MTSLSYVLTDVFISQLYYKSIIWSIYIMTIPFEMYLLVDKQVHKILIPFRINYNDTFMY